MASSSGAGTSECEGEEPEDSSSSHNEAAQITASVDSLHIQNSQETNMGEDELAVFRQQWQRELEATSTPQRELDASHTLQKENQISEPLTDEDKAKQQFLLGVELERDGKLYEAIQHYKRAMQILPDVETRLYDELRGESPEDESDTEEVVREENTNASDDEDVIEGEDLLTRLQRILARKGVLCEPAWDTKGAHISWLPYEVLALVLRWVVGAELDAASLERAASACRGLYVAAREPDIWRSLCVNVIFLHYQSWVRPRSPLDGERVLLTMDIYRIFEEYGRFPSITLQRLWEARGLRTWGIDCGTPRASGFASWRQMFVERPRLHLHGCYISKTTYIRHGENSFQDQFYRPWYLIDYYRYLRFFPEGLVLMWTTPEEPGACVAHLKNKHPKPGLGIMTGHYRLIGEKVVIIIKKNSEKKASQPSNTRFRSRRKEVEQQEQTFHMELELRSVRSRRNFQLLWRRYSVCMRRDQWTHFELSPNKYPPFSFSRVRQYTAETNAPLLTTHAYT